MDETFTKVSRKEREFYLELHKIADRATPKVKKLFLEAIDNIKSGFKVKDLAAVIENGTQAQVEAFLGLERLEENLQPLINQLVTVVHDAAVKAVTVLPASLDRAVAFDLFNPKTVDFLRRYRIQLVANRTGAVTAASERGVRAIIADAFNRGGHPRQQATRIKNLIGLTERQAIAVDNFRETLISQGVKPGLIEKRTARFAERTLKRRAVTIARTETIRAANMGQEMLWRQGIDQGIIDNNNARKVWVLTNDDRLCPLCRAIPPLNPEGVPIDGQFKTEQGSVQEPPLHPQCRCTSALIFKE